MSEPIFKPIFKSRVYYNLDCKYLREEEYGYDCGAVISGPEDGDFIGCEDCDFYENLEEEL